MGLLREIERIGRLQLGLRNAPHEEHKACFFTRRHAGYLGIELPARGGPFHLDRQLEISVGMIGHDPVVVILLDNEAAVWGLVDPALLTGMEEKSIVVPV